MLAATAAKAEKLGVTVTLAQAHANSLPFEDGAVDAVTSRLLLWALLEPEVCVREWARCVKAGGKIVEIDSAHDHPMTGLGRVRRAVANARLVRQRSHGYHNEIAQRMQLPLWPLRDATPYHNVFVRAGLERVLVEDLEVLILLKRRHSTLASKLLWPPRRHYLIEGVVAR